MNPLLEVLCNEINKLKKALTTTGSDYTATVTRVDGNTAYVQMSGSAIADTPVSMTINAHVGDKVRVRVSNGRAWITGNDTAPPSDNKQVIEMIENNSQGLIETEAKYSRIDQTIDNITLQVGEKMDSDMGNRASSISIDSGQIAFNTNSLVVNSSKFTLDQNGNATFGGTLNAAGGSFTGELSFDWTKGTNRQLLKIANQIGAPFSIQEYDGNGVQTYNLSIQAPVIQMGKVKQSLGETVLIKPEQISVSQNLGSCIFNYTGAHPSSDIRLKEDITKIDPETAKHLLPVKFRFKGDDKLHYGFIAQDVQKVMPDAVLEGENGYLSLTYHELIAPLYALVQEQEDRINQLEIRLKALEDKK